MLSPDWQHAGRQAGINQMHIVSNQGVRGRLGFLLPRRYMVCYLPPALTSGDSTTSSMSKRVIEGILRNQRQDNSLVDGAHLAEKTSRKGCMVCNMTEPQAEPHISSLFHA